MQCEGIRTMSEYTRGEAKENELRMRVRKSFSQIPKVLRASTQTFFSRRVCVVHSANGFTLHKSLAVLPCVTVTSIRGPNCDNHVLGSTCASVPRN